MIRARLFAAALAALLPTTALAESEAILTFGLGASVGPEYFGSDDYKVGPTGSVSVQYLSMGGITFGSPTPGTGREGFRLGGSFNIVGARKSESYPELDGLEDIDTSVELGLGLNYTGPGYRAFANLRYGVTGHQALVADLGADAVVNVNDKLTLTAGPRFVMGSDKYVDTYFSVSDAEALASDFDAYDAGGGLVSAGVQLGMHYRFDETWGLKGTVGYSRLMGDAGDSPIVQSRTQGNASLMITRRMSFGF